MWQFRSLQLSLLLCSFVAVVGGAFFLTTAVFIEKDRHHAENYVASGEWRTFSKNELGFLLSIYSTTITHFWSINDVTAIYGWKSKRAKLASGGMAFCVALLSITATLGSRGHLCAHVCRHGALLWVRYTIRVYKMLAFPIHLSTWLPWFFSTHSYHMMGKFNYWEISGRNTGKNIKQHLHSNSKCLRIRWIWKKELGSYFTVQLCKREVITLS